MCSTKLLLWKNQKGSTHYPMTLYKRDSTADVFLGIFNFFGQSISENSSKPLIVKGFYLLKNKNVFSEISQNWQKVNYVGLGHRCFSVNFAKYSKQLFYWTPQVVASSKFKTSGFTEEVMQVNFWISQDHVHLNTLSPNWHFCVYFWQAQVFFCISTASLTFDIVYFFDKEGFPVSFRANLYRNNHIYNVSELSCDYRIEMPHDFLGDAPSSWVRTLPNFGSHGPCEFGDITFLICRMTTWSMCHVTWRLGFPYPTLPLC